MANITLKSGTNLNVKSIVISGDLTDSNGEQIGGRTNFVFIESEINALEAALNKMGITLQAIYDAAFNADSEE